jgi:hypothetical protein
MRAISLAVLAILGNGVGRGQMPASSLPTTAPSQVGAGSSAAVGSIVMPSALVQPGLEAVKSAVAGVRLDKWKATGAVRDAVDANLGSIRRDMEATLPGLLATANEPGNSVSKLLPAYRNIEALYDVLLRVVVAARLGAPQPQSAALEAAMAGLDDGRRALGDRLQSSALAAEKQVMDLRAALKAVPPPPPPAVASPVLPSKKKKTTRKPATKADAHSN